MRAEQAERPRPRHAAYAQPEDFSLEPVHAYGTNAGSLFPALPRLERDGPIEGEWRMTENNHRAKYHALTAPGRAKLRRETRNSEVQTTAIHRILDASGGEV